MRAATSNLARRRGRCLLLAAIAVAATGVSSASAAAAPVLGITMTHFNAYGIEAGECPTHKAEPTAAEPCGVDPFIEKAEGDKGETFARRSGANTYTLTVTNHGPGPTVGKVTVVDQLPEGMSLGSAIESEKFSATGWVCKVLPGAVGVECSTSAPLAENTSFPPIKLYVTVSPQAKSVSTNVATVSESGTIASTTKQEGETTVTPPVPFGVRSFITHVLKEPTNPQSGVLKGVEPFNQAGGHPFAVFTEISLNAEPNQKVASGTVLATAGEGAKEIQAELPPGFTGNPQNVPKCSLAQFASKGGGCPADTAVGYAQVGLSAGIAKGKIGLVSLAEPDLAGQTLSGLLYNVEPSPGHPAALGFFFAKGVPFLLEAKLRSDGDYGVTIGDSAVGDEPGITQVVTCAYGAGETGAGGHYYCKPPATPTSKPFLRNGTECSSSPLAWTAFANPWDEPEDFQTQTTNTNPLENCSALVFEPKIEFKPSPTSEGGTSQADEPTGMTLNLKVPQTNEAAVNATPDVKNVKMTLPPGMTVSPSAADGLQACSNAQFGLGTEFGPGSKHTEPANPASCPLASQIGTAEVVTPLLKRTLQGQLFVAEPECSPCTPEDAEDGKLFRLFLQVQDPADGVIVKLHGTTSANRDTGQLTTTFEQQPQQPFELLRLTLKGGPDATLDTPQTCGLATTDADLTPWSSPFTPDATPTSSFNVEGCPTTQPFSPSFNAGTTGASATTADANPSFSLTFSREDREQNLSGVQVDMPLGLVGKIAGIPRCGEAQANAGTCGPESQIGTAEAGAGAGPDPFFEKGRVYLTGPYKNAPFGLSVVTPAVAGPFNLGNVIVRSAINIDPHTAAVTVTSDPLPQIVDGVPLRLRRINVEVNRPGFMLNPTNCAAQHVAATLSSAQGGSAQVSSPFGLGGCTSLPFHPTFTATTDGHTSKTEGASLNVKITYPPGAYANIAKSLTELPVALPSRLTTIQKACVDTVFESNPAACDEGSVIGNATAHTPLLEKPLTGPAYLVSHGNRAFPDIEIVLQGEGITVDLDGLTDIKKGITKTTFESLPDNPVSSFELNLPEGPHSALAAPANLCEQTPLILPTILTGQNGAVIKQNTNIAVTGCSPTITLTKAKLSGNAIVVTVKTTANGAVKITGKGLKTTKKSFAAGTHQIRVALTKAGRSMRKHHKKVSVRVNLTVGKQVVAKATTVRL